MDKLKFYSGQGNRTEINASEFKELPNNIKKIVKIIQGLLIHKLAVEKLNFSKEKLNEVNLKSVEQMIQKIKSLDPSSLLVSRKDNKKIIVICKHFAMLLTSILRSKGIPSRTRCGFATYFEGGWLEDHWICEYWNETEKRWIMVDAQIDNKLIKKLHLNPNRFNPLDLKKGQFFYGGGIWKLYRKGVGDSKICGFSPTNEFGEWYIRGNMIRDFWSLNKIEYNYKEKNELIDKQYTPNIIDLKLLDKISRITSDSDNHLNKIISLSHKERLKIS
jgi:hypothetical protein